MACEAGVSCTPGPGGSESCQVTSCTGKCGEIAIDSNFIPGNTTQQILETDFNNQTNGYYTAASAADVPAAQDNAGEVAVASRSIGRAAVVTASVPAGVADAQLASQQ